MNTLLAGQLPPQHHVIVFGLTHKAEVTMLVVDLPERHNEQF